MKRFIVSVFLFLVVHFSSAQDQVTGRLIKYDPSFWKEQLHLTTFQYHKIHEINHEFYERLITAYREFPDRTTFQQVFTQCSVNRDTQIWQAMNTRQRKKWRRLMDAIKVSSQSMDQPKGRL